MKYVKIKYLLEIYKEIFRENIFIDLSLKHFFGNGERAVQTVPRVDC